MEPPGRSSLRFFPDDPDVEAGWGDVVPNYNDNQLFCGGFHVEVANGYKCGVCGDNYADARPRDNELGGTYGKSGIIPRSYRAGEMMPLAIQITAHHKGWFEFRLCPVTGSMEDESCFSSGDSLLKFANGSTRHIITDSFPKRPGKSGYWYELEAQIPSYMSCEHCVLQWRYHCGNNWGTDENGSGIGFGLQEEFYGCSDIKVIGDGTLPPTSTPKSSSLTTTTTLKSTTKPETTKDPNTNPTSFCDGRNDGLYRHEQCNMFYQCANGQTFEKTCPDGLNYNSIGYCDWPSNVQC